MSRVTPLSGSDAARLFTAGLREPDEIHTTRDQKRLFLEDYLIGSIWHGSVADETAMIALNSTAERGCFPMDKCYRTDTSSIWLCMTNRGESAADWRNTNAAATAPATAASVSNSELFAVSNETEVAVDFDTENLDTGPFHGATNESRLIAGEDGVYGYGACIIFAANATGFRRIKLRKNGTDFIAAAAVMAITTASEPTELPIAFEGILEAGDYIEIVAYQNSGGSLNVAIGSTFWITKRGGITIPEEPPPEEEPSGELLINQIFETIIDGTEQDHLINQIFN